MEQRTVTFQDYKDIFIRRKRALILPTALFICFSVFIAATLPPVYKSSSTILIEDQEINADYVLSSVTSYAEKRIQQIKHRVMSSAQLIDVINRVGLYKELRQKSTINKLVAHMKENISLEPISVDMVNGRTGRQTSATIAFTISFEGKDNPAEVYKTAKALTSIFLNEDLRDRERQARETSSFLEEEQEKLKVLLTDIDHKIASFKVKNINLLPEVFETNIQALTGIERKVEQLREQMRSIREREGYLEAQIAGIPADEINDNSKRIKELRLNLAHLKTTYSDQYPDVINTKAEIAKLKKRMTGQNNKNKMLADNPSYVILTSQLNRARNDLNSLKIQIGDLENKKYIYEKRIEATPQIEKNYTPLLMKRKNTQIKYNDLTMKVMEAKVAQGLEKEQKGGKFTLLEPPQLPENPFKPNRKAIVLIGIVLGLGAGLGLASILEFSDNAVHSLEDIARLTPFPVLAEIPDIIEPQKKGNLKNRRLALIKTSIGLFVMAITFFYLFGDRYSGYIQ